MTQQPISIQPASEAAIIAEIETGLTTVQDVEARCKTAFLPLLREHGIARVEVHYDGGGDEGSVGDVFAYRDDASAELPTILCDHFALEYNGSVTTRTIDLEDALSAFAENAVCTHHCGWENGEGAHGIVGIDVASGFVTLTHNTRFIDYETSETEL